MQEIDHKEKPENPRVRVDREKELFKEDDNHNDDKEKRNGLASLLEQMALADDDNNDEEDEEENEETQDSLQEDNFLDQLLDEHSREIQDELQRQIDEQIEQALQEQLDQQMEEYFQQHLAQDNNNPLFDDAPYESYLDDYALEEDDCLYRDLFLNRKPQAIQPVGHADVENTRSSSPTVEEINAGIEKVVEQYKASQQAKGT